MQKIDVNRECAKWRLKIDFLWVSSTLFLLVLCSVDIHPMIQRDTVPCMWGEKRKKNKVKKRRNYISIWKRLERNTHKCDIYEKRMKKIQISSICCKWKIQYTSREFLLKKIYKLYRVREKSGIAHWKIRSFLGCEEVLCVVFLFAQITSRRLEWSAREKFELNEDH